MIYSTFSSKFGLEEINPHRIRISENILTAKKIISIAHLNKIQVGAGLREIRYCGRLIFRIEREVACQLQIFRLSLNPSLNFFLGIRATEYRNESLLSFNLYSHQPVDPTHPASTKMWRLHLNLKKFKFRWQFEKLKLDLILMYKIEVKLVNNVYSYDIKYGVLISESFDYHHF